MLDLEIAVIVLGSLYVSLLIGFLVLRRKARRTFSDRPTRHIEWWKRVCGCLCALLLAGAIPWIGVNAALFARLVSSLDEICPSLLSQDKCDLATAHWQSLCILLSEGVCAAILIIAWFTRAAAKYTEPNSDHFYPLSILTASHCQFVTSWILCAPLIYPLEFFNTIGKRHWVGMSLSLAFFAVLQYIFGTTLCILASIRIYYAWRSRPRDRTPQDRTPQDETPQDRTPQDRTPARRQWPRDLERELIRLDFYP